jgi:hypothetical protein
MIRKPIEPARLDDLAAAVGLSIKEANKANISALLASIRENVMAKADELPIDYPPALFFDSR